jgi:non-specific serine/threonine protein kinase/serine/threonine-protein kinase
VTDIRWDRLKDLVYEGLQKPPAERARFLDDACAGDPMLRAEADELLGVDAGIEDSFLNASPVDSMVDAGLQAGEVVADRFRLVRKLGEGGMGQVWLAEQTAPVRRTVALKLIKAGMYDESVVQRFRSERQSLAIMDHPCIAKVFDAGATPQGQPFFVMEYVPGIPITGYCDEHKLSIRERLTLFIQACEGVQHAHQKAIIHRDLKPANILVVDVDGKPVPRIIDFGLAKHIRIEADLPEETMLTRFGQFMGTPGYISPEQVDPNVRDIDTRTDLYSLGVILYVLLTGLQPFENERRQRLPLDQWVRTLREEDPPKPSDKLGAFREHALSAAAARALSPVALTRSLRGDLDSITLKALDRNRERRYSTALDLAADLNRHLNDEPIIARPATRVYQLRKFVRRHRGLAATFAAVLLFSVVAIVAGVIAVKQRNLAVMEETAADRTARFMVSLFELADPGENRGNSVTVREVLDRGAREVDKSLSHEPGIRADLLTAMGQAYSGLGLYDPATKLLTTARSDQQAAPVPAESRVRTLVASGTTSYLAGEYVPAQTFLREAVDLARRTLAPDDLLRSEALDNLADVLTQLNRYPEAERLCREALAIDRKRSPDQAAMLARTLDSLGSAYFYSGDLPAAEAAMREALAVHQKASGLRHALTAQAMNNLAMVFYQSGRYAEAEEMFKQSLPVHLEVYGAEHPEVAALLNNLGGSALMAGRIDEAEPLLRRALAMEDKLLSHTHNDLVPPLNRLGMIDTYNGRMTEAHAEIGRAEQIARLPNQGVLLDQVLLNVADLALRDGDRERAAACLAESRRLLEAAYPLAQHPAETWRYAIWNTVYAELLARERNLSTARSTIADALPIIARRFGATGFYSLLAHRRAQWIEEQS